MRARRRRASSSRIAAGSLFHTRARTTGPTASSSFIDGVSRVLTVGWMNSRPTGVGSLTEPTRVSAPVVMVGIGLNRIVTM